MTRFLSAGDHFSPTQGCIIVNIKIRANNVFYLEMHRLSFSWPITISDFFGKCDLAIPFFADSDFLSKNYN